MALWSQVDFNNLDSGWDKIAGPLGIALYNGQLASATMSVPYVDEISRMQGYTGLQGVTDPRQYAGVAPDGRGLVPLAYGAVTEAKTATRLGWEAARAFEAGAAFLAAVVKTALADMGRMHDMVAANARGYKRYTRVVSPGACSRCAILAGIYSSAVAFARHPNCQCVAVPTIDAKKLRLERFSNPQDYFDSLSRAEQDRIFTKAGAQAIRDGADFAQVVNARRGASGINYSGAIGSSTVPNSGRRMQPVTIGQRADGSPLQVYATREGVTQRGQFIRNQDPNRRTQTLRLMPEQIYRMAGNDPDRARELLIRYGYIQVPRS